MRSLHVANAEGAGEAAARAGVRGVELRLRRRRRLAGHPVLRLHHAGRAGRRDTALDQATQEGDYWECPILRMLLLSFLPVFQYFLIFFSREMVVLSLL